MDVLSYYRSKVEILEDYTSNYDSRGETVRRLAELNERARTAGLEVDDVTEDQLDEVYDEFGRSSYDNSYSDSYCY